MTYSRAELYCVRARVQLALSKTVVDGQPVLAQELWMQPVTGSPTDVARGSSDISDTGDGSSADASKSGEPGGDIGSDSGTSWTATIASNFYDDHRFAQQQGTFLIVMSLCEAYDDRTTHHLSTGTRMRTLLRATWSSCCQRSATCVCVCVCV